MDDSNYTRFRLNLAQFSVELAGEKNFVEELYRKVYRDLLPLINTPKPGPEAITPQPVDNKANPGQDYTWIYSCTPHYNKVYVVENSVLVHSIFGRHLDPRRLRRIYLDRANSPLFRDLASGNRTLWAEITPEGRRMIEAAAQRGAKSSTET
ncbi:MAG: hypothetical protein RBU37_04320 [Myxococcota bacterium]|nr:hypothetical protein [Myxococcota bacterium]